MNTKNALESLAMDLKRVALGYHRGSDVMAKRFSKEALKRIEEVDQKSTKQYINVLLKKAHEVLAEKDVQKLAEDSLMLSTLFQNYTQTIPE